MIVSNHELFIDQLKLIDYKCYDYPWCDQGWLTAKEYQWRIIVTDNIVMGYCCFRPDSNGCFVAKLAVKPCYQHYGLGSLLMADLVNTAKINLCTILHEENPYLGWAAAHGWRAVCLKRGLFPDDRDGIFMERKYGTV